MNKKVKIGLLCVTLVLSLTAGTLALMYYVLQAPVFDRSGWEQTENGIQYWDYYGRPLTGWQQLDGETYFFHPSGKLATGFAEIEEERYLLSREGTLQRGWVKEDGKSYYLNTDGSLYTGWLEQGQKRWYLDSDGTVHTGWLEWEGKRYYLSENGTIQTGWMDTDDGRYYLESDGSALTGWLQTDLARYYMDAAGKMQTGFAEVAGSRRYFLPTGEYIPLVNPWNPVPEDFTPRLTELESYQVDTACRDALEKMLAECREAGYECHINSAYRDVSKQQELWDQQYESYIEEGKSPEEAKKLTNQRVAVPGTSEHHLGFAVDLGGSNGCTAGWRPIVGSTVLSAGIPTIKRM
ncbi:MAG: D-alanyl-D-alanine carboxypeptidase family protein [Oscillospiraceae bacterium]|nr:D-alanyl-D-alanine carboxypeptidase family protein [Oscillospiraceae bacterium]